MQQDTFVKERTALAVQPEQGEDTIDLLELFMGLLAHWTLIAATAVVGAVLMARLYVFSGNARCTRQRLPSMWSAAMIRC